MGRLTIRSLRSIRYVPLDINALQQIARSGDKEAENKLFRTLSVRFKFFVQQRVLHKEDVEDIVQSTLSTIAEKYKNIEFRWSFARWAYSCLEKNVKIYYRSKHYRLSKLGRLKNKASASGNRDYDPTMKMQLIECIKKVSQANRRYARILNLYYQGYTTDEISEKLRVSRENTYVIFHRARTALRQCLEDGENDK